MVVFFFFVQIFFLGHVECGHRLQNGMLIGELHVNLWEAPMKPGCLQHPLGNGGGWLEGRANEVKHNINKGCNYIWEGAGGQYVMTPYKFPCWLFIIPMDTNGQ